MRIGLNLLFLVASRGGGIERHVRGLISGLQQIDRDNEYVLFTNKHCAGTFPLTPNFREVPANVSAKFRPAKLVFEQSVLPYLVAKHQLDVLLSPANTSPFVHDCPSAVIIHDMIPYLRPEVFTLTERAMLKLLFRVSARRNQMIITDSESSKRDIVGILGAAPESVVVIPCACDAQFRPVVITDEARDMLRKQGLPASYILYVAAARSYKNVDGLLRAYKLLKDDHKIEHSLVITGLGGRAGAELQALTAQLDLTRDVVFSGFLDDSMLPLLYSAADVFVYPSFYEGFGLPVLEAMACGTPVAASNRTSVPEAVGDAGILFDPSDDRAIADSIHRILTDAALRADLVAKGLARARTFTWDKTASATLSVLTALRS